jgi:hypothetical protein
MAKRKKGDWKHLLLAGSIILAVVGTLFIAWLLQTDPPDPAVQMVIDSSIPDHQYSPLSPSDESERTAVAAPPPEAPEQARATPPPADLEARAGYDLARLREVREGWTLKFATLCSRESVSRKLAALSGHDQFYLLPTSVNGRDCHRLCWGLYSTRDEALAAGGIPEALNEIEGQPAAMPLHKVVE